MNRLVNGYYRPFEVYLEEFQFKAVFDRI
jgi:hypothetical protein